MLRRGHKNPPVTLLCKHSIIFESAPYVQVTDTKSTSIQNKTLFSLNKKETNEIEFLI